MYIFSRISEVREFVEKQKENDNTVGFVPTMGALHSGHISLVEKSLENTDITIVSIFVNPTQFNDVSDLENYPREFEKDRKQLEEVGCHAIFYPEVDEMYPEKDDRVFEFGGLDGVMEGEHRPGHFNGVAQIVSKLFYAIPANKAFFGLKDFQQLAIIKRLVQILKLSIEIVPCDIVREPNGLAMSSRNERLTAEQRESASIIYENLLEAKKQAKHLSINEIKSFVVANINKSPLFSVEYFDIVNSETLLSVIRKEECNEAVACVAVWADKVRLIDNIILNF